MFYLLLAILSSTLINIFMRLSNGRAQNRHAMLSVNYITCALLAFAFSDKSVLIPSGEGAAGVLILGIASGILYLASFLLLNWNISKNGVVLPATFMKLGVIVPIVLSVIFYKETLSIPRILGILISIAAICFLGEKNTQKRTSTLGLAALLVMGGITDFTSKIFDMHLPSDSESLYLLYTFASAFVLCILLCVSKKERFTLKDALFGMLIGYPNYFSSFFLLKALAGMRAVVAFPTFSIGTILLVAVSGRLIFKEKLSKRKLICLTAILVALVLLNI